MHALYELETMLCEELEETAKKGQLTAGTLDTIDKLSHALKNVQKVIDRYEESEGEYSGNYGGMSYGIENRNGINQHHSFARGGRQNAKRDSYGRYSRGYSRADASDDMLTELRSLMASAPNEQIRSRVEDLIRDMEIGR